MLHLSSCLHCNNVGCHISQSHPGHGLLQTYQARLVGALLPPSQWTPSQPLACVLGSPLDGQDKRRVLLHARKRINLHSLQGRNLLDDSAKQVETEPSVSVFGRALASETGKDVVAGIALDEYLQRAEILAIRETEARSDVLTARWLAPARAKPHLHRVNCSSVSRWQTLEKSLFVMEEAAMNGEEA